MLEGGLTSRGRYVLAWAFSPCVGMQVHDRPHITLHPYFRHAYPDS